MSMAYCVGGPYHGKEMDEYEAQDLGYYPYHRWYRLHDGPSIVMVFNELLHEPKTIKLPRAPRKKKVPKPEVPVIDMERVI